MSDRTRRTFTDEQKLDAINVASELGVKGASQKLGINESVIHAWKRKFGAEPRKGIATPKRKPGRPRKLRARHGGDAGWTAAFQDVVGKNATTVARWLYEDGMAKLEKGKRAAAAEQLSAAFELLWERVQE